MYPNQKIWSEIVNYLINSLEDYLQQPIKIVDETIEQSIVDGQAICCSIRSSVASNHPFEIAWEARLGIDTIDGKTIISVSLFLFSHNKRLCVAGQTGSYLELVYEKFENSKGAWRSLGWLEDVYSEFEDISEFSGKTQ